MQGKAKEEGPLNGGVSPIQAGGPAPEKEASKRQSAGTTKCAAELEAPQGLLIPPQTQYGAQGAQGFFPVGEAAALTATTAAAAAAACPTGRKPNAGGLSNGRQEAEECAASRPSADSEGQSIFGVTPDQLAGRPYEVAAASLLTIC